MSYVVKDFFGKYHFLPILFTIALTIVYKKFTCKQIVNFSPFITKTNKKLSQSIAKSGKV